ncbi:MAG: YegP family protein [Deltaproteobacteria bacterium]|nr:YegP family protein [Deltaproteobacteria bacterium]
MRNLSSLITVVVLSLSSFAAVGCATSGSEDEYSESEGEASLAGKFTMWQSTDGQWRFNLKSGNGAVLLSSEAYTSRTGAINGILSVQENGVDPTQYQVRQTQTGYNVHLLAGNHESISFSQVYSTKSSATRAVGSSVRAVTSYLDKREANTTGARVDVLQGDSGQFRFNFFARNGQVVLSSEAYTTAAAAFNGAFAVQTEGQNTASYSLKENSAGGFYFTVQALNGQIVGVSQQYTTRASAQDGMTALQTLLPAINVL